MAFLQSNKYADGKVKRICFKHPVTGECTWQYFEQDGPIYGENSAPIMWGNTIAPWLEDQGFITGENERSVYYHPDRDLLILLYVDDVMARGESEQIEWIFKRLEERFDSMQGCRLHWGRHSARLPGNGRWTTGRHSVLVNGDLH